MLVKKRMEHVTEELQGEDSLYIRWNPHGPHCAIELKLDAVTAILAEMRAAEPKGFEIAGVLFGALPDAPDATLRISAVEFLPHDAAGGITFHLDPAEHELIQTAKLKAEHLADDVVGFFRTHRRAGPLRLSLADRGLLAHEFGENRFIVLLIEAVEPHPAAFFLSDLGQLPEEPSVHEFQFDDRQLNALPEIPAELPDRHHKTGKRRPAAAYGTVAALLVIAILACVLMWRFSRDALSWHGPSSDLKLSVLDHKRILRITWNSSAREIDQAAGGTLRIQDGSVQRDILLGVDELRVGAVEYERSNPLVRLTLILTHPGAPPQEQTVTWSFAQK